MNCIKGVKIEFCEKVYQCKTPKVTFNSHKEFTRMKNAIEDFVVKGAVERCEPEEGQFLSPYFIIPKSDGTDRFILNLCNLNNFVKHQHFKMKDMRSAVKLIFPNYFMATLDLKDAYFLVSIHHKYRKFLRFKFKGILYQFTCLPFGLSSCPYIFIKIMKPVINFLRSKGLISILYIDDWLLIDEFKEGCLRNIKETIDILEKLGFIINYKKSQLKPSNI